MVDSGTNLRGEVPKKVLFFCDSCYGQNVDLDREEGAGGPTIARSLSSAHVRSLCRREGEQSRKSGGRDLLKWTFFVCLFFRCTARRWPVRNELFLINCVVDGTSGERFLTITFRISLVKYRVYFLVVCLFFPRSRIDFQKKLDEKHKKNTSCPKVQIFDKEQCKTHRQVQRY